MPIIRLLVNIIKNRAFNAYSTDSISKGRAFRGWHREEELTPIFNPNPIFFGAGF